MLNWWLLCRRHTGCQIKNQSRTLCYYFGRVWSRPMKSLRIMLDFLRFTYSGRTDTWTCASQWIRHWQTAMWNTPSARSSSFLYFSSSCTPVLRCHYFHKSTLIPRDHLLILPHHSPYPNGHHCFVMTWNKESKYLKGDVLKVTFGVFGLFVSIELRYFLELKLYVLLDRFAQLLSCR